MILDVAEWNRFEIHTERSAGGASIGAAGDLAGFAAYRLEPGRITFTHTEIKEAFGGRGLGGELARGALDAARRRRLAVIPQCPFIRAWIAKHPEYVDLVPEADRARFSLV